MKSLRFLFFIFGLTISFGLFGQTDKKKVIAAFDSIVYYPDSTIESAYRMKNKLFDGYSVDFDSLGNPISIGKYKKGIPVDAWYSSDGSVQFYEKGEVKDAMLPGCGTGIEKAKKEFQKMYQQQLNEKRNKRKS